MYKFIVRNTAFGLLFVITQAAFAQKIGLPPVVDLDSALKFLNASLPLNYRDRMVVAMTEAGTTTEQTQIALAYNKHLTDTFGPQLSDIRDKAASQWRSDLGTAIQIISKTKSDHDLSIILPYLGFTDPANDPGMFAGHGPMDMDQSRKYWPVLNLIMDMPHAQQLLATYCDDSHNSIVYRLDACHILHILDKEAASKYVTKLKEEIANNTVLSQSYKSKINRFIDGVEASTGPFVGEFEFN
jgi:hypothetical protein